MPSVDLREIEVLAPNFKTRLSGVTATIVRLLPLQSKKIAIAAVAPDLPPGVPHVRPLALLTMSRRGPSGPRIWHARRNSEMLVGILLNHLLRKELKLVFTSASQRHHTAYSKWLIGQMDALVATSEKSAAFLTRPATVIPHGIDTEAFAPSRAKQALKAKLNLPPGPLLGCFGRIRPQKGTETFVDALLQVLPHHPEAAALIMGRATRAHRGFLDQLKAKLRVANLMDRVQFLPEVPVQDMADWYRALDVYIAPQHSEGFGLTPLEAMACGVPTIATRVGAFEEMILPGKTGALIPPQNAPAMAEAIDAYLSKPVKRTDHGQAARRHMERHFQLDGEADALIKLYRLLLGQVAP